MKHFLNLGFRFAVASLIIICWSLAFLEKIEGANYVVDVDETFNCIQQQFNCSSGGSIPMYWACDTVWNCGDGSDEDENMCRTCNQPCLLQCDNGSCIRLDWRCDGFDDCGDYSDEYSCPRTSAPNAAMN